MWLSRCSQNCGLYSVSTSFDCFLCCAVYLSPVGQWCVTKQLWHWGSWLLILLLYPSLLTVLATLNRIFFVSLPLAPPPPPPPPPQAANCTSVTPRLHLDLYTQEAASIKLKLLLACAIVCCIHAALFFHSDPASTPDPHNTDHLQLFFDTLLNSTFSSNCCLAMRWDTAVTRCEVMKVTWLKPEILTSRLRRLSAMC